MKPKQQRIAIARACGEDNDSIVRGLIPDYLNDLNAMHEAEKVLHEQLSLWWNYMDALEKASVEFNQLGRGSHIHALAAQRAEAFLRTLNLWKP